MRCSSLFHKPKTKLHSARGRCFFVAGFRGSWLLAGSGLVDPIHPVQGANCCWVKLVENEVRRRCSRNGSDRHSSGKASGQGQLRCLDLQTGQVRWRRVFDAGVRVSAGIVQQQGRLWIMGPGRRGPQPAAGPGSGHGRHRPRPRAWRTAGAAAAQPGAAVPGTLRGRDARRACAGLRTAEGLIAVDESGHVPTTATGRLASYAGSAALMRSAMARTSAETPRTSVDMPRRRVAKPPLSVVRRGGSRPLQRLTESDRRIAHLRRVPKTAEPVLPEANDIETSRCLCLPGSNVDTWPNIGRSTSAWLRIPTAERCFVVRWVTIASAVRVAL